MEWTTQVWQFQVQNVTPEGRLVSQHNVTHNGTQSLADVQELFEGFLRGVGYILPQDDAED